MAEATRPPDGVETLRSLNAAVLAMRVFPVKAPQIEVAVERAFATVKQYVASAKTLCLHLKDGDSYLAGEPLPADIGQVIPNLLLFRQLQLLEQQQLCLQNGIDQLTFSSLLKVLSAKVEEIKRRGGGPEFIRLMRLEQFFSPQDVSSAAVSTVDAEQTGRQFADKLLIKQDFAAHLLGYQTSKKTEEQIRTVFNQGEDGARLLAGALAAVLSDLHGKRQLIAAPVFAGTAERCRKLIETQHSEQLWEGAARMLLEHLPLAALCILLAQDREQPAVQFLIQSILKFIGPARFSEVVQWLQSRQQALQVRSAPDDPQLRYVDSLIAWLFKTTRGCQYIGQEKVKNLLAAGEIERRKKRVQAGLNALLQGNVTTLENEELLAALPSAYSTLIRTGRQEDAGKIIQSLAKKTTAEGLTVKGPLALCLAAIGETVLAGQQSEQLALIATPLLQALQNCSSDTAVEKIATVLARIMNHSWNEQQMVRGDEILAIFHRIRAGAIRRPARLRESISRVLDQEISTELLEQFFKQCQLNPNDEALDLRLTLQGPVAARFLLDLLMRSENTDERLRIIDLLSADQHFLPEILTEKLAEPMPWYGKRNLLKLLGESGRPEHLEPVYVYLAHEDLRIQREAFLCIYKVSGDQRKDALLRALPQAGENVKLQIVRALLPYADSEVLQALRQIIEEREHYSVNLRDELLISVCQVISRCPVPEGLVCMEEFLDQRLRWSGKSLGEEVWQAAEDARKQLQETQGQIKKRQAQALNLRKNAVQNRLAGKVAHAAGSQHASGFLRIQEDLRSLLAAGNSDQAGIVFLDAIGSLARQKNFQPAEQLLDWFGNQEPINFMALIKAGETISAEKKAAIDKSHLEIWSELYDTLSTDEFNAFYHALRHQDFQDEDIIARKGAEQTALYFINSGRVKLVYRDKGHDTLIKTMGQGEVLGAGAFFDISVWTVSALSVGVSNLSSLDFQTMTTWQEQYPALEAKLHDYCQRFETVDEFFRNSNKDRRQSKRLKASGHVTMELLDSGGQAIGVSKKGLLIDVSAEGLSMNMRITNRANARQLLGRDARFALAANRDEEVVQMLTGKIVAVRELHTVEQEYSLHVQLASILDQRSLQELLMLGKR